MYEIIKKYEGFRSKPYLCPAGYATIGYGNRFYPDGREVTLNDEPISEERACFLLDKHIQKEVNPLISKYVKTPLNINQKASLQSFVYNLGLRAFRNANNTKTTLQKCLECDDFVGVAEQMKRFIRAGGKVLPGLVNRRAEEAALFLKPSYK